LSKEKGGRKRKGATDIAKEGFKDKKKL